MVVATGRDAAGETVAGDATVAANEGDATTVAGCTVLVDRGVATMVVNVGIAVGVLVAVGRGVTVAGVGTAVRLGTAVVATPTDTTSTVADGVNARCAPAVTDAAVLPGVTVEVIDDGPTRQAVSTTTQAKRTPSDTHVCFTA
ncbi:MAG: hypothetical protein NVSMB42_23070 [Herpetosiphon sp.]